MCIVVERALDGVTLPFDLFDIRTNCCFQVAERQGRYLADFLNKGCPPHMEPFRFKNMGMLAYIGRYEALVDTPVARLYGKSQKVRNCMC